MRNQNFTSFNFDLAIFCRTAVRVGAIGAIIFFSTSTSSMDVIESIILFND
jgi:hypothetical protein